MSAERHPLCSLRYKLPVKGHDVSFADSVQGYAQEALGGGAGAEKVLEAAKRLDHLRTEITTRVVGGEPGSAGATGGGNLSSDNFDACVLEYCEAVKAYASHIPETATPDYVWTDALSGKSQAAKSPRTSFDVAACLFNLAAVASTNAASISATHEDPTSAASSKLYLKAAGAFKLLEAEHAAEDVFDLKAGHLAAMRQMMVTQAHHCFFLRPGIPAKSRATLAWDCRVQYADLESRLRHLPQLPPHYHCIARFFAEYFRQQHWVLRGADLSVACKDVDKTAFVGDNLGPILKGLHTIEAINMPPTPDTLGPQMKAAFARLADALYAQIRQLRDELDRENRIHNVSLSRVAFAEPDAKVKCALEPKVVALAGIVEDPLAGLPSVEQVGELKAHKLLVTELSNGAASKAATKVGEVRELLGLLNVMSLLGMRGSTTGEAALVCLRDAVVTQ